MLVHMTVLILLPQGASLKIEMRPGQQPLATRAVLSLLHLQKGPHQYPIPIFPEQMGCISCIFRNVDSETNQPEKIHDAVLLWRLLLFFL